MNGYFHASFEAESSKVVFSELQDIAANGKSKCKDVLTVIYKAAESRGDSL